MAVQVSCTGKKHMRKVEVRAQIEQEGELFRLDIISVEATGGGMPQKYVQSEDTRFLSRADAKSCARHKYGIKDQHIR